MSRRGAVWLATATAYVGSMAFLVYGVLKPSVGWGNSTLSVALGTAFVLVHVAVGFAIGRWWAVLLPSALAGLALPAGYPQRGEDLIWPGVVFAGVPIGVLVIAAGVTARWMQDNPRPAA